MHKNPYSHGHAKRGQRTREFRSWDAMLTRCYSPSCKAYSRYGGRGIIVCEQWKNNFARFLSDMGPSNGLTLERINNEGNYEPSNCRWATYKEQRANRRAENHKNIGPHDKHGRFISPGAYSQRRRINGAS